MDILADIQTAKDNYAKLEADYSAATELIESSQAEVESLKVALSAGDTTIVNLTQANDRLEVLNESLRAELAELKA